VATSDSKANGCMVSLLKDRGSIPNNHYVDKMERLLGDQTFASSVIDCKANDLVSLL
jgi:hypothetical protein